VDNKSRNLHEPTTSAEDGAQGRGGRGGHAPQRPTQLPGGSWWAAVKRTVREFQTDNLSDWAAALTYYSVLSIFPALLVLISLIDLAGPGTTQRLLANLGQVAPGSVNQILHDAITNLRQTRGSAGLLALVSLATALWLASRYIAAFMRASNAIYDVPEGRPVWKTLPIRIGVTIVVMVLLAVSAVAVVATGGLAARVGRLLGIGSTAIMVWDIAKWPVLLLIVGFLFALLYWASPNARQPFRWITPRGDPRRGGLGDRLGGLRALCGQLRLLQQDLRQPGRRDHLPGLAVAVQRRHPAGGGAERRAGTGPGHRCRPPGRGGALHGAARHPKDPRTRQPVARSHDRVAPRTP
jgi:YihY family inner membrane protein